MHWQLRFVPPGRTPDGFLTLTADPVPDFIATLMDGTDFRLLK
jgi:hypothetical protein